MVDKNISNIDALLLEEPLFANFEDRIRTSPTGPGADEQSSDQVNERLASITWALQPKSDSSEFKSTVDQSPFDSSEGNSSPVRVPIKKYLPERRREETFVTLQSWEGLVIEVEEEIFQSRLVSTTDDTPDQYAEIYIDEVDRPDRALLKPGAVFYWTIGYLQRPNGTTMRGSILRFRRLPPATSKDLERAKSKVTAWEKLFASSD